ncbi:MAG: DNA-processing protein DprA [Gammaproteobacteria bacterium]|jgi:DNA processing protein
MGRYEGAWIKRGSAHYPEGFQNVSEPPPGVYVAGNRALLNEPAVAMVGSRKASHYGIEMAEALAFDLAKQGWVIVSGFAQGIDTAAHRGALAAGGKTIAVLGCGLAINYPKPNRELRLRLEREGLVVSEFEPNAPPYPAHFPQRNRLIAGLSVALVVVEARDRSGSLITARLALESGTEVGVVPGPVTAGTHSGCHALLKDGAHLIETAADVMQAVPPWVAQPDSLMKVLPVEPTEPSEPGAFLVEPKHPSQPLASNQLRELTERHHDLLNYLGEAALSLPALSEGLSSPIQALQPLLTELEIGGFLVRQGAVYRASRNRIGSGGNSSSRSGSRGS